MKRVRGEETVNISSRNLEQKRLRIYDRLEEAESESSDLQDRKTESMDTFIQKTLGHNRSNVSDIMDKKLRRKVVRII